MKYLNSSSISRIAYVASFLLIAISILTLNNVEISGGYEASFYENIPFTVFIGLALAYVLAWLPLFLKNESHSENFTLTVIFSSLYTFVITSLWLIKYHRFYGIGDVYVHLISTTEIINNGHVNADGMLYPALHMLLAVITQFTGSDLTTIYNLAYPVCSILFVLLTLIISLEITESRKIQQVILLIIPLNPMIMDQIGVLVPYTLSAVLLLLNLYVFLKILKCKEWRWTFLFILGGGIILISHIFIMIYYIFLIIGMLIYAKVSCTNLRGLNFSGLDFRQNKYFPLVVAFLLLISISWVIYVSTQALSILDGVKDVLMNVFNEQLSFEQTRISSRSPLNFLLKRVNLISQTALAAIISVSTLYLVIIKRKQDYLLSNLMFLMVYFIISAFLFLFTKVFLSSEFGIYGRYVYLASMLYPVFLGFGVYGIFMHIREKIHIPRYTAYLFFMLMFIYTLLSLSVIYPSPSIDYYSSYTTENTLSGMKWGFTKLDVDTSKVMGGGDQIEDLGLYMFGKKAYPMLYGSTNGMLEFIGLDHTLYEHRGFNMQYDPEGKKEYVFYESLMEYFLANPKYTDNIATVNKSNLEIRTELNKIYENCDFSVYNVVA